MSASTGRAPGEVYQQAIAALNLGQWQQAQSLAAEVGRAVPGHAGVHFVAGVAALELQQMERAIGHLRRACELNDGRADYQAQLARALVASRHFPEAHAAADRAMQLMPTDAMTLDTLGVVYSQLNVYESATTMFRQAATLLPNHAGYRFNLATGLMFIGELTQAEAEYEACIALEQTYWKAHLALSQLRRQTADANHLERLRALLGQYGARPEAQLYLNLSIAREQEDLGDYISSFQHLSAGKHAVGRSRGSSSARDADLFDSIVEASRASDAKSGSSGHDSDEPIFVIGMPRSGTTLVERIISSHSSVQSMGELQNFSVVLKRASGSLTRGLLDPDTFAKSISLDWEQVGRQYVQSTRPGTGSHRHFIDKLPHNFLLAGCIAKALPRAKIICLRRDPVDTCLSNFRQLFALSSPYYDYSFDLLDTGRYYLQFDRLMRHWEALMPGRILSLSYETLVDQQEQSTRVLLEHCGLPFEPQCLAFERNAAAVATASLIQVRSGINRSYVQRWRRYGNVLDPLIALLAEGGIVIDD